VRQPGVSRTAGRASPTPGAGPRREPHHSVVARRGRVRVAIIRTMKMMKRKNKPLHFPLDSHGNLTKNESCGAILPRRTRGRLRRRLARTPLLRSRPPSFVSVCDETRAAAHGLGRAVTFRGFCGPLLALRRCRLIVQPPLCGSGPVACGSAPRWPSGPGAGKWGEKRWHRPADLTASAGRLPPSPGLPPPLGNGIASPLVPTIVNAARSRPGSFRPGPPTAPRGPSGG
jgi:hypothetical protein